MSVIVQIPPGSGNNETIPSQGDENWANYTTATLIALAQSTFPKAGGPFFITGQVDFGPNYGITAGNFTSSTANLSKTTETGVVRLGSDDLISWDITDGTLLIGATSGGVFGVTSDTGSGPGTLEPFPTTADPQGSFNVNLTGSPGSNSANCLRSDVVLILDQGISPVWTASHEFRADVLFDGEIAVEGDALILGNMTLPFGSVTLADGTLTCATLDTSSDETIKTNINVIENSLEKINELRGVTFNWKSDNSKSVGLIAQDVEKIFPELVSTSNDVKHLNYLGIIGLLVESIKELQMEVTLLNNGMKTINSEVELLNEMRIINGH